MKQTTRWLLILTLLPAGFSTPALPAAQLSVERATPAPDFTARSLTDDTSVRLSSLRGKVVVLNFWASWCPPCRAEFPLLAKLHNAYKGQDFVLLSLNFAEDPETARQFIRRETPPFRVYVGASAAAKYDASRLPTTYFIDRAGRIRRQVSGFHPKRSEAEFTAVIDALLAEPNPGND